jgi:hypothetical protein
MVVECELEDTLDVWRYLSLPAFISLLQREELFFPTLTTVQCMDPFEGKLNAHALKKFIDRLSSAPRLNDVSRASIVDNLRPDLNGILCISCWHENEVESAAMWKLYSGHEGVAVLSSIERLKRADLELSRIDIKRVEYDDDEPEDGHMLEWWRKRRSFAHEREVRMAAYQESGADPGIYMKVDLEALVREIRLSPTAPAWHLDVVRGLTKRYELDAVRVEQSALSALS